MEFGDEVYPGLFLQVTPRGVKSFSVIDKVPGKGGVSANGRLLVDRQHRITLDATPPLDIAEAREKALEIVEAATEGHGPRPRIAGRRRFRTGRPYSSTIVFPNLKRKPGCVKRTR